MYASQAQITAPVQRDCVLMWLGDRHRVEAMHGDVEAGR